MYNSQQPSNAANDLPSTTEQNLQPPASKWFREEQQDSSTDQVGLVPHNRGYKLNSWAPPDSVYGSGRLRSSKNLATEEEYTRNGKKRTVVKKRKRLIDEELSEEEEEDPYTQINIEDILSPIEVPTDIVRRSALKRIIKSPQIGELAKTAMEFIENEKNYTKILSRLSAILHQDDPQYLDLTFERTREQRKRLLEKKKNEYVFDDEQKEQNGKAGSEKNGVAEENNDANNTAASSSLEAQDILVDIDGPDREAEDVVRSVRELLLENINFSNEYLARLSGARDKLTKAHMQKEALWKQLKENARKEQDRRRARHG